MRYERHVFVCGNERPAGHPRGCCAAAGGEAVRTAFKNELARRGLAQRIRINQTGCFDLCEHGPSVVVYPEQVWYGRVRVEDVPRIVEEHLIGGQPVESLCLPEACLRGAGCAHRPVAAAPPVSSGPQVGAG